MSSSSTAEATASPPLAIERGIGIRHLWSVVAVGALAVRATSAIQDNSFLWHIRAGTMQLDAGSVLRSDPFSFTALGDAWRTQSWLLELGYGALERSTGGLDWVRFMLFLFGTATVLLVGVAVYGRVRDARISGLAIVLVTWVFWFFLVPRPVGASFVFLAATIVVLQRPSLLAWTLVPLVWLWAAVHGTFIIGLGLIALEAVRQRSSPLARAGALGAAATLFTAHGIGVWSITAGFFANREALAFLSEWAPPDFQNPALVPFLLVLGGLLLAATRGRLDARDLIVVFPFVVLGLTQQRTVLPAMLVLIPYAAPAVAELTSSGLGRGSVVLNRGIAATIAVGASIVLIGSGSQLSETKFPSAEVLADLGPAPVFNDVRTGGYLIWRDGPERLVLVDDRAELYGAAGFEQVVDAINGSSWQPLFDRYGISQAIVDPEWPLTRELGEAGWRRLTGNDEWALYAAP